MFEYLFFLSSGLFLGWSLGANDASNIFGTAVGTKMLRFRTAAAIACFLVAAPARAQFIAFAPQEIVQAIKRAVTDVSNSKVIGFAKKAGEGLQSAMGKFNEAMNGFIKNNLGCRVKQVKAGKCKVEQKAKKAKCSKWAQTASAVKNKVSEGQKLYKEANQFISDAKALIDEGTSKLEEGKKLVEDSKKLLEDGMSKIKEGQELIEEAAAKPKEVASLISEANSLRKEAQDSLGSLTSGIGKDTIDKAKAEAEDKQKKAEELENKAKQLQKDIENIQKEGEQLKKDGEKMYEEGEKKYKQGEQLTKDAQALVEKGKAKKSEGEALLADAKNYASNIGKDTRSDEDKTCDYNPEMYRKLSCVLCAALTLTAVSAVQAAPEAADDISARLEKLLREQENLRQESKALLTDISALEKELPDTQTAQEAFEKNQAEKIAESVIIHDFLKI